MIACCLFGAWSSGFAVCGAEVQLGVPGCTGGVVESVGREEIIDDAGAVLVVDDTQTDHPCEQQRPHELAHGKLEVELVELSVGVGTLQDGFKRLAVVLDDACLQCAFASLPVSGVVGTVGRGSQGYPGQGRRMQRCLFVQRRLAAHQFDKPVTQRPCRRWRRDRGQEPFECGGKEIRRAAEVAVKSGAGNL